MYSLMSVIKNVAIVFIISTIQNLNYKMKILVLLSLVALAYSNVLPTNYKNAEEGDLFEGDIAGVEVK